MKKNKITDKSVHIHQGKKLSFNINIKQQQILTEKQKLFLELALKKESKIIFVSGPAELPFNISATILNVLAGFWKADCPANWPIS